MVTHLRGVDGHAAAPVPSRGHGAEDGHPVTERHRKQNWRLTGQLQTLDTSDMNNKLIFILIYMLKGGKGKTDPLSNDPHSQ